MLQLKHNTPKSLLYTERYGYKSGINNTMKKELKEIVEKATGKIKIKTRNLIALDIGANDGTLLGNYGKDVLKVGAEPIKKLAKECKQKADIVINDFFNQRSFLRRTKGRKSHIITAISCFYDIEDPNIFLSDIKKILNREGIFIIQQNYLVGMIEQNAFDNIVHEHLEYYSLLSLERLLKRHSLEIFDVEQSPINGGSFRTFICHRNAMPIAASVGNLRNYETKLKLWEIGVYKRFATRVEDRGERLHKLISNLVKNGKTVYAYGASTRGNTLLQFCRLNKKLIQAAVERNSEKWGKKIASLGVPIISEEQARREKPDYMLVLPWFFKEEFLKREDGYLKNGGHFIFPLPEIEVV